MPSSFIVQKNILNKSSKSVFFADYEAILLK